MPNEKVSLSDEKKKLYEASFLGSFRQILRFLLFFGIFIFSVAFVYAYDKWQI